ncbi:MAG: tyrosine-type recombinase/integrase [Desulfovibrio sp.]|nr:tyrosine-type recombinase/integrase [Desulfovibrio sp.]
MSQHNTLFSQTLSLILRHVFQKLEHRHKAGRSSRKFGFKEQFTVMAFIQLAARRSMRDCLRCLEAVGSRLYHFGLKYVCGTLRRILKHALQHRIIIEAPPSAAQIGATAPKDNRRLRVLTQDELTKLLDEIKRRDLQAWRISMFAMIMGCRFSDAARLLWGQVDFERKTVSFVKTKTVARVVVVGDELLSFLKDFGPGLPSENVFINHRGQPYKEAPSALRAAVDELKLNEGRAANDRFSFHNLRHMAATDLARDLPLRDLMDYMGWKTPAMALRYMHGNEEIQRAAIAAREARLTVNRQ